MPERGSVLKCQLRSSTALRQITKKSGRVATVVSLVDEDRMSLEAFATSCNLKDLNKTNDPMLNLTPENIIQHSRIE